MRDAQDLIGIANDLKVADMTLGVKYPFDMIAAKEWLSPLALYYESGVRTTWAIAGLDGGPLMGMISLSTDTCGEGFAELGFWIGSLYWGNGYATEAGWCVINYAIQTYLLSYIKAYHFSKNLQCEQVLKKLGFVKVDYQKKAILKWNNWEDIIIYKKDCIVKAI